MSSRRSIHLFSRFTTLLIALAMGGCAAEMPSADELARLEAEGPYSDAPASDVAVTKQALDGVPYSVGFVWASSPSTQSYSPSASYSYNSANKTNVITRLGTGRYRVDLPSLSVPGGAQVSAYGTNSHRCNIGRRPYSSNGGVRVTVNCHDVSGNYVDTTFNLFYQNAADDDGRIAFAHNWAELAQLAGEVPTSAGVKSITRTAAGNYRVTLESNVIGSRSAFVTAVGENTNYCKAHYVGGTYVDVRCYNTSGNLSATDFSFLYLGDPSVIDMAIASGRSTGTTDRNVNGYYSVASGMESVWFDYGAVGAHSVTFYDPEVEFPTHALVTASGSGSSYCKPSGWGHSGTDFTVNVRCFTYSGGAVHSMSNVAALGYHESPQLLQFN